MAAQTTPQLSRSALRSVDSGLHTCTLVDEVGNFGNATLQVVVQGIGPVIIVVTLCQLYYF